LSDFFSSTRVENLLYSFTTYHSWPTTRSHFASWYEVSCGWRPVSGAAGLWCLCCVYALCTQVGVAVKQGSWSRRRDQSTAETASCWLRQPLSTCGRANTAMSSRRQRYAPVSIAWNVLIVAELLATALQIVARFLLFICNDYVADFFYCVLAFYKTTICAVYWLVVWLLLLTVQRTCCVVRTLWRIKWWRWWFCCTSIRLSSCWRRDWILLLPGDGPGESDLSEARLVLYVIVWALHHHRGSSVWMSRSLWVLEDARIRRNCTQPTSVYHHMFIYCSNLYV